jgi:hypothetical protein
MGIIRSEILLPDGTNDSTIEYHTDFGKDTSKYVISHKGELYEEVWPNDSDYRRKYLSDYTGNVSFGEKDSDINYAAAFSRGKLTTISYRNAP